MAVPKNQPILALSVAASLLRVHPRTLMLYEKEGLIKPHRTTTNRRLFSSLDLTLTQFIQHLASQKRVNLAGVKLILELLEKTQDRYPNLKEEFFPDYSPKDLI